MKKLFALLLALIMLCTMVVGCDTPETPVEGDNSESSSETEKKDDTEDTTESMEDTTETTEDTTEDTTETTEDTTKTTEDTTEDTTDTNTSTDPFTLSMKLDVPAGFEDAPKIEVESTFDMEGGYVKILKNEDTGVEFEYAYLKKTADNPHITVDFDIEEAGTYKFAVALMAYNSTVPRTGLVQVDDGDMYYIYTEHGQDRHLTHEYFVGMTVELTEGWHTFNFYLADDFDDKTVKSVYFDFVYYVKA